MAVVLVLALLVALLLAGGGVAGASSSECVDVLGLDDPGVGLPVVLVHGFRSSPSVFDEFVSQLEGSTVDFSVERFDYSSVSREWVDHPDIAPRLREVIICLADASAQAGGVGRVAVVAHSMGGLAARAAIAGGDDGRGVLEEEVALVVTLGTPHTGAIIGANPEGGVGERFRQAAGAAYRAVASRWGGSVDDIWMLRTVTAPAAQAMAFGSEALAALPAFPEGIPVMAAAGEFVGEHRFLYFVSGETRIGDIAVPVGSATAQAQAHDQLGGADTIECFTSLPSHAGMKGAVAMITYSAMRNPFFMDCLHTRLTRGQLHTTNILTHLAVTARTLPQWTLALDGLGRHDFGASATAVISDLTRDLGQPSFDSGRVELFAYVGPHQHLSPPYCDDPEWCIGLGWDRPAYRNVCFEMLCLVTDPDRDEFVGWNMRVFTTHGFDAAWSDPPPQASPQISTSEGITVGSTYDELRAAYPEVAFSPGEGGTVAYDIGWPSPPYDGARPGTGGLSGRVVWTPDGEPQIDVDGAWIQTIAAGDGPSAGCC